MNSLVGYTGFVGSNLADSFPFDGLYHTKNIAGAFGTNPELLVYSGVRAEKFLANSNPEKDFEAMKTAFENIQKINPQKLVLISTVDVFANPCNVDEDSPAAPGCAYGANRLYLEQQVRTCYPDALIIRLPGLFGKNLKKNFIFDMMQVYPSMLNAEKFSCLEEEPVKAFYKKQDNGFYQCTAESEEDKKFLRDFFQSSEYNALHFTDSRGYFQFYPLQFLWSHIKIALVHDLRLLHAATEPVAASALYQYIFGHKFNNMLSATPPYYNFKTNHAYLFGGANGYIFSSGEIMDAVKAFVKGC